MTKEKLNICIIAPEKNVYSETFIRSHVKNLPGNIFFLYGGEMPVFEANGKPLVDPPTIFKRIRQFLLRKLFNFDFSEETVKKKAFRQFLTHKKIDVVLAEFGPTGSAVQQICVDLNIPLTVHFHGFDAYEEETLNKFENYKDLFRSAASIVAVSKDMRNQLIKLGAPEEKTFHIVYGIDLAKFDGAHPREAPATFVSVGRFGDKKAPHLTILAFKEVYKQMPQVKLIMGGDGPLLEECKQIISSLGMNNVVTLRGRCSHEEVAEIMKRSRGFLQHSVKTSYGDSEGTPVAILEACATGLPIVSTYHAGIPDVVIDGETGFLVNEGDIMMMAGAIVKLAKDPELAQKMGQKAQHYIRENFSQEKSIAKLYQVIQDTVNKKM